MIGQAAIFSAHVVLVLAVFTWVGLSTVRLLPAALASRPWYAAAPLGFAITTAWMGSLTELGVTGWVSGGTLLAAATVANAVQVPHALRALAAAPRGTLARPLAISLGLTLLACAVSCLMVFRGSGVHFGDPWGSGDYFYYWFAGDYIAELGGAADPSVLQQKFDLSISYLLFYLSFRPGSYAPLDLFLWFGPSGGVDRFLIPLLTADVVLILLALRLLLEIHQVRSTLPLLLVGLCSLNYLGVRFSYVAQYAGVALLVFSAVGLDALAQPGPHRRTAPWMVGVLLLAGVTSYDNQLFPVALLAGGHAVLLVAQARFGAHTSWKGAFRTALSVSWIPIAVLTVSALVFSQRILSGIRFFASVRPLPGWEWSRLPAPHDILGFSWPFEGAGPALPLWKEAVLFAIAAGLCLVALRSFLRSPGVVAALAAQSAQLLIALFYYRAGIGNASHAVWKSLSLFSLFVPLLCGVAVVELGSRLRGAPWRPVSLAILVLMAGVQLRYLRKMTPVPAWYDRSLVELVRRNMGSRDLFVPVRDALFITPAVRWPERNKIQVISTDRRVVPRCTSSESVAIWDARAGEGGTVLDGAGPYRLGLPPRELNFPTGKTGPWVLWGLEPDEGGALKLISNAQVLLGALGSELEVTARALGASSPVRVKVSVDDTLLGEAVFDGSGLSTQRFPVPPEVLERCRSLASIRLEPVPGPQEPGSTSSALGLMRLAFRG